jgi:type IV pilus assembly protein PilA
MVGVNRIRRIMLRAFGWLTVVCLLSLPRVGVDVPYLRYADETAAIKAIQTIHTMQVQYNSQYGRYAASVTELGPPASGAATAASTDLIDSGRAGGGKSGYKFTMTGNQGGYAISAVPSVYGNTGSRTFYSDQSMVIRENAEPEPATAGSQEMK